MALSRKYKLIIADDHKMFLDGLLSIIANESDFEIVMTANSGQNVIKYLDNCNGKDVDLVITDINMPDVTGIELNKHIKTKFPTIRTLVVSMRHDSKTIHVLTEDNVDGYVPKNAEKGELIQAIETIVKGEKYFSESIKKAYMDSMFNKEKDVISSLTKREKEVLKLIAEEYTTQEIADKLFLSKHTIEGYRKNLISKLEVRNLAGLTKYAIQLGLLD
ncbi:DNA-binding response regulator [Aureibaculum marinum]|uniref:DNA-binding response regulator n=1 Tax=Aureibaculum marinum TaxID=2487930 RepID=A0A3N4N361_9FLAO|nr:response regulator transcription factor [Aureibaculum marinum]RPD90704.1 DNA-binding response regulator [Aureibaculum marinum]